MFDNIPSSWPAVGILYTLYENPTLFPIPNDDNENCSTLRSTVATPVLAATVGSSLNFAEIHPPIVITLIPKEQSENITVSLQSIAYIHIELYDSLHTLR